MAKYAILSDIHSAPLELTAAALEKAKKQAVDAIILNGDLIGDRSGYNPQQYLGFVLDSAAKLGLPIHTQFGSHELVQLAEPVIDHFTKKTNAICPTLTQRTIQTPDHDIVFLPGSDINFGPAIEAGYRISNMPQESGFYTPSASEENILYHSNMADLKKHIRNPDKTIVVCHVPPKFSNIDSGIDYAHFLETFNVDLTKRLPESLESQGYLPAIPRFIEQARQGLFMSYEGRHVPDDELRGIAKLVAERTGLAQFQLVVERKDNRGNADLGELIRELGVKKFITGHFHEAAHRAHDLNGVPVKQGDWTNELFWMASYVDEGKLGILHVDGPHVSYQNIQL